VIEVGQIVFTSESYGDAKPHHIYRVENIYKAKSIPTGMEEYAKLNSLEQATISVPVILLVPLVQQERAQELFNQYQSAYKELYKLSDESRKIQLDPRNELDKLYKEYRATWDEIDAEGARINEEYSEKREALRKRLLEEFQENNQ
jgi:2-methylcitrate dehydratase PrpD